MSRDAAPLPVGDPMTGWRGHPWAPQDGRHDPNTAGPRCWCSGCNEWCSPRAGCSCCTTLVCGWLMAEARWWAEQVRDRLHWLTERPGATGTTVHLPWEDHT